MFDKTIDLIIRQLQRVKSSEASSSIDYNTPLLNPDVVRISSKSPLDDNFYQFSVFNEYNLFFRFNIHLSIVNGNTGLFYIAEILNSIVIEESTQGSFSFGATDAISASRSNVDSNQVPNAFKWKTFEEFGKFSYRTHLPEPSLGVNDINNVDDLRLHRELLKKIADDTYKKQLRLGSVIFWEWCNRYILLNGGRSRRFAACAYLAKNGDEYFDRSFDITISTKNLNFKRIRDLDSIMDTYVLIADNKYHSVLRQFLSDHDVPVGEFHPLWHRDYLGYDLKVYFILKPDFIEKIEVEGNDHPGYSDIYNKTRIPLKQQFDRLKEEGLCIDFNEMVKRLSEAWTVR